MKTIENTNSYHGILKCPGSKSYMQRAIAIALLANGETTLHNPNYCNDTNAVLNIAEDLGALVNRHENSVSIKPGVTKTKSALDVGESGLAIRMLAPLAALFSNKITISGHGSLRSRPMGMIEEALNALNAQVSCKDGLLPVTIKGPLTGGNLTIDGSISSQLLTGLLIVLPVTKRDSIIHVKNLNSRPYIDMTIEIMKEFGVYVTHKNYQEFHIPGNQQYKGREFNIEGDWSGAAFHLAGGAIAGDVTLTDIDPNSKQSDIKILDALRLSGAEVQLNSQTVRVKSGKLRSFHFDATHCPDLIPPLSNLAASCEGESIIKGVNRLIHKESNRAIAIQKEWGKLGIDIVISGDELRIRGGRIKGGMISSHNDHRIAMMGAVASLRAQSPIHIQAPEAINKSYGSFYEDLTILKQLNK